MMVVSTVVALEKGTGRPSPLGLRTAAIGALTDPSKRVEIRCELEEHSLLPMMPVLSRVSAKEITKLVPNLPKPTKIVNQFFAKHAVS